jgi:hypothetical protein
LGIFVPFGPPASINVRFGAVIRVATKEVDVVLAGIVGSGAERGLLEIDGDKVPLCAEDALRVVADEEEFVATLCDVVV